MSTLTLADPTAYLRAASGSDAFGRMVEEAKGNCGPILQAIDWAMVKVLHWSPIEAIMGPVAGDFNGVDEMKDNWSAASKALAEVGANYTAIAGKVRDAWTGVSAVAQAEQSLRDLGSAHTRQSTAASLMSRQLNNMLSSTAQVCQAVAGLLGLVEEWVLTLSVAKLAKELLTFGSGVRRAIKLINQAIDLITSLAKFIPALLEACGIMATVMSGVNIVINLAASATHGQAAGHIDDTANAGFPGTP